MELEQILCEMGVEGTSRIIEEIFNDKTLDLHSMDCFDKEHILSLNREYGVLGEYEEEFIRYVEYMMEDEALVVWTNVAREYFRCVDGNPADTMPFPLPKKAKRETSVDIFPMLILMEQIPTACERYRRLGADEETVKGNTVSFGRCLKKDTERHGKLCLTLGLYAWLCLYIGGEIFNLEGYNFQITKFYFNGVYIRNKATGERRVLMLDETVHKSGYVSGSAGCEDTDGDWLAKFEETEDAFIGYPALPNGTVDREKCVFSKSEWKKTLTKGDWVFAMHIPKNADLTSANLDRVFEKAVPKMKQFFGDKEVFHVTCCSWLLSPQLKKILKPTANITAFGDRFLRIPVKDSGDAVFSTVFPPNVKKYEDLPETNSLERGLKQMYMRGEYIYNYTGAFEI